MWDKMILNVVKQVINFRNCIKTFFFNRRIIFHFVLHVSLTPHNELHVVLPEGGLVIPHHMHVDVISIQQELLVAQSTLVVHLMDELLPVVPMDFPVLLDVDIVDSPCVGSHDV